MLDIKDFSINRTGKTPVLMRLYRDSDFGLLSGTEEELKEICQKIIDGRYQSESQLVAEFYEAHKDEPSILTWFRAEALADRFNAGLCEMEEDYER